MGTGEQKTGRDAILEIATGKHAQEEEEKEFVARLLSLDRNDGEVKSMLQYGVVLSGALKTDEVPVVPFVNRSKIGRLIRQNALKKFIGQHLALLLRCRRKTDATHSSSSASCREDIESLTGQALLERAIQRASEQEMKIFKSCSSHESYKSRCMHQTVLDWCSCAYTTTPPLSHVDSKKRMIKSINKVEKQPDEKLKKQKIHGILVDSDIDWDMAAPESHRSYHQAVTKVKKHVVDYVDDRFGEIMSAENKVELVKDVVSLVMKRVGNEDILGDTLLFQKVLTEVIAQKVQPIASTYRLTTTK